MNKGKGVLRVAVLCVLAAAMFFLGGPKEASAQGQILAVDGVVTFLRVHDVGTGYGPSNDFLDAEVIVSLDSTPDKRFGFQLRSNDNQLVAQAMLNMLQQAYDRGYRIRLEYFQEPGKTNNRLFRVIWFK